MKSATLFNFKALNKLSLVLSLLFLLVTVGCGDKDTGISCNNTFNQSALYSSLANERIIPAFTKLNSTVDVLNEASQSFVLDPTSANLEAVQLAFTKGYKAWQSAAPYAFGPAEEVFLTTSLNNYPLNITETLAIIESGNYTFDQPDNYDKGFPALDFILFEAIEEGELPMDNFVDAENGTLFLNYLSALTTDIKERVDYTLNAWNVGYKQAFTQNTGTAAGTSLSLLINQFNFNYERLKRDKIGVPSGAVNLGFILPEKVEAYYSGISLELATIALQESQDFFLGSLTSSDNGLAEPIGLDDYLNEVGAVKNGSLLSSSINDQFESAKTALNNLGLTDPLSIQVENNSPAVVAVYQELSKQLVNIKTDLPSVLCVSITYIDNPSDSD